MAAEKKETAQPAAAAAPAAPAPEAAAKPAKPMAAMIPVIATLVLAPVVSIVVAQFVLLPQFKKQLALPTEAAGVKPGEATAPAAEPAAEKPEKSEKGGKGGKKGEAGSSANSYEFENVVVNLAGTMGTRYLKTTFIVTGSDTTLRATFEGNRAKLLDVTLNVLSSLSIADLEEAGARNLIREKLIGSYNQTLGKKVAEQVYFSDFVVQ